MTNQSFQWAVIGAGPAGIAAVGKLLDNHIDPASILWLDPQFNVGDLGRSWRHVSSNTTVGRFIDFLHDARSFNYQQAATHFQLNQLPAQQTCLLNTIVEPLQWVSNHLKSQVYAITDTIYSLQLTKRQWLLSSPTAQFTAQNVILATGALPAALNYPGVNVLPFDIAIDKQRLAQQFNRDDTYAVFGSSHSAIIIIRHLVELGARKIINFYRSPCRYAVDMGDWILFDNTGLKGATANWAREHIDGTWPSNLVRYPINEQHLAGYLTECQKVIYAVGFQRRTNLIIEGYEPIDYNPHIGIIAPGLFGLGIAYPEQKQDRFGTVESQVGLWKFMTYLTKVLPVWLVYGA